MFLLIFIHAQTLNQLVVHRRSTCCYRNYAQIPAWYHLHELTCWSFLNRISNCFVNNTFLLRINHWLVRKLTPILPFFHEINLLRMISSCLDLSLQQNWKTFWTEVLLGTFKAILNTTQIVELYTSFTQLLLWKILLSDPLELHKYTF